MGFFRAADGGTLFLDEVGELDLAVQAKLLRCIQDRAVVPLGDTSPVPVNVRVIAASHRDLQQMVDEGRFREDLYFRLDVVRLHVPPLRERLGDIPALAAHLIERIAWLYGGKPKIISGEALARLGQWHWPGNVRQLANALEHSYIMTSSDQIDASDLPPYVLTQDQVEAEPEGLANTPVEPLEDVMKRAVARALKATEGHQGQAAQLLQIERHRLYRMVKRYGLKPQTRNR
jgi:transcriptional regulator with PAS, ATPase and Fis domain